MTTQNSWNIIDFHAHIRPPWFTPKLPKLQEERVKRIARSQKMMDVELLARETEDSGISLRLINSTIEGYFGIEGPTDIDLIRRINDFLADVQSRYPGRIAALSTVNAYSGDEGAREVERTVTQLGHAGIVVDSYRDGAFLSSPLVRPTLEAAARLKVPVLVHPVSSPMSDALREAAGIPGYSIGRSFMNGVAFFSALRAGIFEAYPDLHLVFPGMNVGALLIAGAETEQYSPAARASGKLPNAYFDIMGLDAPTIRYLVDFLGADKVLTGSDWPIWAPLSRPALADAFERAGLNLEQQKQVAEGNARRLLTMRNS